MTLQVYHKGAGFTGRRENKNIFLIGFTKIHIKINYLKILKTKQFKNKNKNKERVLSALNFNKKKTK